MIRMRCLRCGAELPIGKMFCDCGADNRVGPAEEGPTP